MALNLGRSSSIRDHDIQTDRPKFPPEELGANLWGELFYTWFDFAKIQGEIYDQLYCAQAQKEFPEVKAELARSLATRLTTVQETFMIDSSQIEREPFGDFIREGLLSITIIQYSTLYLIYRIIPPASD